MTDFEQTYLGQIRALIGHCTLLYPAVRAVIRDESGRVLFIQRGDNHRWRMPAGGMEPGESITECLKREVLEETGLEVLHAKPISIYSEPRLCVFTNMYGDVYHLLVVNFLVEPSDWHGTPRPDNIETLEARFFALDDPNLPDIGAVNREILADLTEFGGQVVVK